MERAAKSTKVEEIFESRVLSDDIIENLILPRLPVKLLFQFKSVCKKWRTLITDDTNFRLQQSLTFNPPSGLLYWNNKMLIFLSADGRLMSVPDPELSFLGEFVSVKASCNGLICGFYLNKNGGMGIYVCNPVTQETRSIPTPKRRLILGLAFNPSAPNPYYKLICPYRVHNGEYGFDMYSSRTRKWMESNKRIQISSKSVLTGKSFYIDGILYFRATNEIVWIHTIRDIAGFQALPPTNNRVITSTLGNYKSRLSYTQVSPEEIEIWTLNEFCWEELCCFRLDILDVFCRPALSISEHLVSERSVEGSMWNLEAKNQSFRPLPLVLEDVFLFQVGLKVYFYNIRASEVSEVCPYACKMANITCLPYVNSFVPLP